MTFKLPPVLLLTSLCSLFACTPRTAASSQAASPPTLPLTSPAAQQLTAQLRASAEEASTLLAYSIGNTGCDYRAYFLSMQLATQGIASRALYGLSNLGFKFIPQTGITWEYHVAPSVLIEGEEYILDPTLRALGKSSDLLLKKADWLKMLGSVKQGFWEPEQGEIAMRDYYFSGSFTLLENMRVREQGAHARLEGIEKAAFEKEQAQTKQQSFASMPAFAMRDINEACKSLVVLVTQVPGSTLSQQQAVIQRFASLTQSLETKGKLKKDAAFICASR